MPAEVVQAGGLFVGGGERHESRRIFGSERMDSMLQRLGLKEGEATIHPWVNKALAKAQQKVEARNYDIRKQLLKYDDVMNDEERREIMNARDVASTIADMRNETIEEMVALAIPENSLAEQWDTPALHAECLRLLALDLPLAEWAKEEGITGDEGQSKPNGAERFEHVFQTVTNLEGCTTVSYYREFCAAHAFAVPSPPFSTNPKLVMPRGASRRRVRLRARIRHAPSDFFRRNVVLGFQEDAIGIRLRDVIGPDNLMWDNMMWGSDYPHSESTFPQSRKILAEILAGVPEGRTGTLLHGSASGRSDPMPSWSHAMRT